MVFHGGYEKEFDIYKRKEGETRGQLLGHMAAISTSHAKARWIRAHEGEQEDFSTIYTFDPDEEWR